MQNGNELTIEALAAQSGMTVRNIRAHRARGLLPAPEVRERVGYYGSEHLARLRLIARMQAEGFNLRAIGRLLKETHGRPGQLLSFRDAVSTPFETERAAGVHDRGAARALRRTGRREDARAGRADRAADRARGGPLRGADAVAARRRRRGGRPGVPIRHALSVLAKVREQCRTVAREFVKLYLEDLWKPFAEAGYPEERWAEVTNSIDRLRPLSSQTLLAVFQLTMSQEVEAAFGRELERLTKGGR